MEIEGNLIDEIYEAAIVPELWPKVLDRISQLTGALGGSLLTSNWRFTGWTASPAIVPLMHKIIQSGWAARNSRIERNFVKKHPGFVRDQDLFTPEEIERDPFYHYLRTIGCGWVTGTFIEAPSGDTVMFSWERSYETGPFTEEIVTGLGPLRPHLARAALLSGRIALERAKGAVEALSLIGLPAAVLSPDNRVIFANKLIEDLTPEVIQDRRRRVTLKDTRADALLTQALAGLEAGSAEKNVRSIPIRSTDVHSSSILHVVPIRGAARDIFLSASCILLFTPFSPQHAPSAEVIRGLFDLTAAEIRVASGIAEARTIEEVAIMTGATPGTVRQQLKSVFAKTGVSRQAELVRLLVGRSLVQDDK